MRLEANEQLTDEQKKATMAQRKILEKSLKKARKPDQLKSIIEAAEIQAVEPILNILDRRAEQRIRAGVRDIMLAVTLSPYRVVDLLIVLYRNLVIVRDINLIYNSRPRLRENISILIDTIRVVATVNFINLGTKMVENVTRGLPGIIPGVSRIVDDCTEGIAAGLLTSVTGYAAKERCRAFRRWNYEEARENIASHLKTFTADVGKMFFTDIIPHLKIPGGLALEKWKEVKDSITRGFNDTIDAVHNFIRFKPAAEK